jgi:hypothetical protein
MVAQGTKTRRSFWKCIPGTDRALTVSGAPSQGTLPPGRDPLQEPVPVEPRTSRAQLVRAIRRWARALSLAATEAVHVCFCSSAWWYAYLERVPGPGADGGGDGDASHTAGKGKDVGAYKSGARGR